jgi:hypothetical protein
VSVARSVCLARLFCGTGTVAWQVSAVYCVITAMQNLPQGDTMSWDTASIGLQSITNSGGGVRACIVDHTKVAAFSAPLTSRIVIQDRDVLIIRLMVCLVGSVLLKITSPANAEKLPTCSGLLLRSPRDSSLNCQNLAVPDQIDSIP